MQTSTKLKQSNILPTLLSAWIGMTGLGLTESAAAGNPAESSKLIADPAVTTGFSYDFIDVGYAYTAFDEYLDDSHGTDVQISKSLTSAVYLLGGFQYDHGDYDGLPGNWDAYGIDLGLGVHFAVTERLDLTFEAVANHNWYDGDDTSEGWGLTAGPGFRYAVCEGFELYGVVGFNYDFEESGDLWDYRAGALIDLASGVGINVGGFVNKEASGGFAGIRIYY